MDLTIDRHDRHAELARMTWPAPECSRHFALRDGQKLGMNAVKYCLQSIFILRIRKSRPHERLPSKYSSRLLTRIEFHDQMRFHDDA